VDVQVERLVRLRGMTEAAARARIAVQATDEARRAVADIVIDNSGALAELAKQIDVAWDDIVKRHFATTKA
jgi:dephospho-CoA kinase